MTTAPSATSFETILVDRDERVATVTLNRPKVLNALNAQLLGELRAALEQLDDDSQIRAIVITGAGDRAFAAGADIGELNAIENALEGARKAKDGQDLTLFIERMRTPVIMAVNGFALGGGCELAMAGDIRIASENAKFGQPEVNLGLIPGYGGTQRTTRLLGKGFAMFLCLSGDTIDAQMALQIGLVERVVAPDQLLPAAIKLGQTIASKAPLAIQACKSAINEGAHLPLSDALSLEALSFGTLVTTADFREGTSAFLEKRPPNWKGK
ncbi:MAG: enoyl-CoA hydratase/isomerase family protein [Candidatus Eremiobacteraeota bacterium]|nr:enoyl-CoA hydratase/isomerase family protein [Candidatus Eremiobacteraeota bacterium]